MPGNISRQGNVNRLPQRHRRGTSAGLRAALLGVGVAWPVLGAAPALAQLAVCNQTVEVVNLAMAQNVEDAGAAFTSEGWWTVGANRCVNIIKSALSNRFVYLYATDVFGQPVLSGTDTMCVGSKKFSIRGTDSCWQRGFKVAAFLEVDTQGVSRWTVFIKPQSP